VLGFPPDSRRRRSSGRGRRARFGFRQGLVKLKLYLTRFLGAVHPARLNRYEDTNADVTGGSEVGDYT